MRKKLDSDVVCTGLLASALVALSFLLQGRIGLNWADEGYLWYGTLQTAAGQVPIRDFQSYDPGRYYWAAAWSRVLGGGIMGLRSSLAIFQALGLALGLLALRRAQRSWSLLAVSGLSLLLWMQPRHKLFEPSLSMAMVLFGVRLVEKPSPARHFWAGVFVGLAAVFGRNLGLYSALTATSLAIWGCLKVDRTRPGLKASCLAAGILVGYLPVLLMLALVPGFAGALIDSLLFYVRYGHTNLPLPVPWPWIGSYRGLGLWAASGRFLDGAAFLLMPILFCSAAGILTFANPSLVKNKALLVSAVFTGLFFEWHAFSRADLPHLAQSIHPFLIALFALPAALGCVRSRASRLLAPSALLAVSIPAILPSAPLWARTFAKGAPFVEHRVLGDTLWVPQSQARALDAIAALAAEKLEPEDAVLVEPVFPTVYCLLRRRAPIHDTYLAYPLDDAEQSAVIRALQEPGVRLALIWDAALDGREELRFHNTQPKVWKYLNENYTVLPATPGDPSFLVFLRPPARRDGHRE